MAKLTAATIGKLELPAGKLDHIFFDHDIPGFGLRLREGGSRTYVFQYKLGSKQRRLVLGRVSAIKPDAARAIASEQHAKVRLGRDPATEKALAKIDAANTFGELLRRYLEHQQDNLRPRSYYELRRHLENYAKRLHRLPLASVDRRSIADLLNRIAKESGNVTSNRVRSSIAAMFAWGIQEGIAETNPVAGSRKREEKSRDRVLSDAELKLIWDNLNGDQYGAIVRLLMLTGQRANEIAALRWSEIDLDGRMIFLPAERTKNGRPHSVPMSDTVRDILAAQPRPEDRELVFGHRDGPFSGWSKSKGQLDERISKTASKPLPHWTPHDLRRTCATRMADLGVQPHVIEAVLNHVSGHKGGIAGIYNRAQYAREKEHALTLWADHVAAIVAVKVPLLRQRA
jgi:integrase